MTNFYEQNASGKQFSFFLQMRMREIKHSKLKLIRVEEHNNSD